MLNLIRMKLAAAISGLAMVSTIATVALASPGSGFSPQNFVTARLNSTIQVNNDRVKFQTKGATDIRMQKLTFAAGAFTAWAWS